MAHDGLVSLGGGVIETKTPAREGFIAEEFRKIRSREKGLAARLEKGESLDSLGRELGQLIPVWAAYGKLRTGEHYAPDSEYAHRRVIFYGDFLEGKISLDSDELAFAIKMNPPNTPSKPEEAEIYQTYLERYSNLNDAQ